MSKPTTTGTGGESPGGSANRWRILGLLMGLCFISHMNRISMAVAGDARIMKQHSLSPEQMGMVYSAFLAVYTVCMVPGGLFIDRVGPRTALLVVGIGSAVFGGLTGLAGWLVPSGLLLGALVLIRGTMGLVTTPLHPGCARAVGQWMEPSVQSLANGWVTGAAILGVASTYWVFSRLIERFDWPGAFLVTSGITVVVSLALLRATRGQAAPSDRAGAVGGGTAVVDWRGLIRNRRLLFLTLSYAAVGYFQYLFFYWMHYYFSEVLKLGKGTSEQYAALPPLAMAVGMPIGGWLSDRLDRGGYGGLGRAWVPLVGMIGGGVFVVVGLGTSNPAWSVAWFSLALGFVGACEGTFWSTAIDLGRGQGGTAAAIVNMGGNAGGMLAPLLTPWISRAFHWHVGIGLGGVICLLGAVCWIWIGSTHAAAATHHDRNPP